jgi:hypothetical protein
MNYLIDPATLLVYGFDDAQVAGGHVPAHLKPCSLPPSSRHTPVFNEEGDFVEWILPPLAPEERAAEIRLELGRLNHRDKFRKGVREFMLRNIEHVMAPMNAQQLGITTEEVLSQEPFYQQLLTEDNQVDALEDELRDLGFEYP